MPKETKHDLDYAKATELLKLCEQQDCSAGEIALQREAREQGVEPDSLLDRMRDYYRTMRESVSKGLAIDKRSGSGLSGGDARRLMAYAQSESPLFGQRFARTIAYGFAVLEGNAQFGRIVATPTAGSASRRIQDDNKRIAFQRHPSRTCEGGQPKRALNARERALDSENPVCSAIISKPQPVSVSSSIIRRSRSCAKASFAPCPMWAWKSRRRCATETPTSAATVAKEGFSPIRSL